MEEKEVTRADKPKRFRPTLTQYRALQNEVECWEKTADSLRIQRDELVEEYRKQDGGYSIAIFLALLLPVVGFIVGYILRGFVK